MKDRIKFFLQNLFGFKTYLFLFSKFKIASLKWDKKENHFLHFLQLMPDNGIILDVGANIGIMTAWLAKEKPNAQVVSFEPIKENFEVLTDIVKDGKFKNVSLRNIALGKENGNLTMIMPVIKNAKQQGLSHVFKQNIDYEYDGIKYDVPVQKLDDIFKDSNLKICGIKMDVENFEYEVLLGSIEILKKHKPILYIELWDNDNRKNCFELMLELGYRIEVLIQNKLVPFTNQNTQNFFFV